MNTERNLTQIAKLIEFLAKAFKTHRAEDDFDARFVNSFVPAIRIAMANE